MKIFITTDHDSREFWVIQTDIVFVGTSERKARRAATRGPAAQGTGVWSSIAVWEGGVQVGTIEPGPATVNQWGDPIGTDDEDDDDDDD
jgi:hypothetical protein